MKVPSLYSLIKHFNPDMRPRRRHALHNFIKAAAGGVGTVVLTPTTLLGAAVTYVDYEQRPRIKTGRKNCDGVAPNRPCPDEYRRPVSTKTIVVGGASFAAGAAAAASGIYGVKKYKRAKRHKRGELVRYYPLDERQEEQDFRP